LLLGGQTGEQVIAPNWTPSAAMTYDYSAFECVPIAREQAGGVPIDVVENLYEKGRADNRPC
jgi:hypothetical protein